jgi:hypothetical protein
MADWDRSNGGVLGCFNRYERAACCRPFLLEDYLPFDGSAEAAEFTSRNQMCAVSPGA